MRREDFFEVLGEIDDNILKGAESVMTEKIKKPNWKVWGIVAACLCLVVVLALASPLLNGKNIHPRGDYTIEEVLVLPQEAGMYVEIVEWQGEGFKAIVTDPGDNDVFPEKAELTILFNEESEIRLANRDMFKYNADEPNAEAVGWEAGTVVHVKFIKYVNYLEGNHFYNQLFASRVEVNSSQ